MNCYWYIGVITLNQSGPKSNGYEGILHISQNSKSGNSPPNFLTSYLGQLLAGGSYPSTAPVDWDKITGTSPSDSLMSFPGYLFGRLIAQRPQLTGLYIIGVSQTDGLIPYPRLLHYTQLIAQSAGAVEYTDCFSAEG